MDYDYTKEEDMAAVNQILEPEGTNSCAIPYLSNSRYRYRQNKFNSVVRFRSDLIKKKKIRNTKDFKVISGLLVAIRNKL